MASDRGTAVVVIDMLNRYDHEDADELIESVREVVPKITDVVHGAREKEALLVYVNDNYGDWTAEREQLCARALEGPDRSLVEPILPPRGAVFLTKLRHSAFYETQLEHLLRSQDVSSVALVGQVTEQCILYTALDAYVRGYEIVVPRDAVAHIHEELGAAALRMMEVNMRARIVSASELA
jgi:nicotinamidase-related amidase